MKNARIYARLLVTPSKTFTLKHVGLWEPADDSVMRSGKKK